MIGYGWKRRKRLTPVSTSHVDVDERRTVTVCRPSALLPVVILTERMFPVPGPA